MRLFIGIALPSPVSERLLQAAHRLTPAESGGVGRTRWTQPAHMHVTLSFLGQVEPARLEQIQQSLAAIRAARLPLELSGIGTFANAGVLLAKLKPSAALLALADQVFLAMEECGFPRERCPYTPHITLARAKGRIPLRLAGKDDPAFWQAFEASEFRLYESFTRPDGAHYELRKAFPLG